jgi:hypothetical protein
MILDRYLGQLLLDEVLVLKEEVSTSRKHEERKRTHPHPLRTFGAPTKALQFETSARFTGAVGSALSFTFLISWIA